MQADYQFSEQAEEMHALAVDYDERQSATQTNKNTSKNRFGRQTTNNREEYQETVSSYLSE